MVTNNRIFVEGQRWAQRGPAPSVAELKDGKPVPYPDAGWNAWEPGAPVDRDGAPDGTLTTVASDPRLHWVDAMWLEPDGTPWAPTPELDRIQAGKPATVRLWTLRTR